jgi:drug/metabolite transporter (DMT)-like permease
VRALPRPGARGLATLAGVGAIVLWASETLLVTLTDGLPPLQVVALAFAVAALPSPLVWRATGADPRAAFRQPLGVWLLTVPSLLGYHACLYYAAQKAPAAAAALLQGCTPLLIVVGSALLPGERPRWWHLVGTVAGLSGALTLVAGEGDPTAASDTDAGFYLAVVGVAAALWGVYSLLTRTFAEVPTSAMGVFYAATAAAAGIGHLAFERWVPPDPVGWAAILALGLLPTGLALYLWDHGIKRGDLQALGAASYAEPFLGAALVGLLGRGELGWPLLWAGVLIVGGAALAARNTWHPEPGAGAARDGPTPEEGASPALNAQEPAIPSEFADMLAGHRAGLAAAIPSATAGHGVGDLAPAVRDPP